MAAMAEVAATFRFRSRAVRRQQKYASPAGKAGEGGQACLHFRIGAGLGGPGRIDRLLLVDADLLRDVVPLSCRRIEDRLRIFACPELANRLAQ